MFLAILRHHIDTDDSCGEPTDFFCIIGHFETQRAALVFGHARECECNFLLSSDEMTPKLKAYMGSALGSLVAVEDLREAYLGEGEYSGQSSGYRLEVQRVEKVISEESAFAAADKLATKVRAMKSYVASPDIAFREEEEQKE